MRLILMDVSPGIRANFAPVALSRPIWELRVGMTSLAEKIISRLAVTDIACFVPDYMAEVYRDSCEWSVNDTSALNGDDLLLLDPRVKAESLDLDAMGHSGMAVDVDGNILLARIPAEKAAALPSDSIESFIEAAKNNLPQAQGDLPLWNYLWDLILANPQQLTIDFAAAGRSGIEGTVEEPAALRGSKSEVYVAPGALVHPMVVIDAANGPVYIDEGAEIHPFSRIEGPCYIGKDSILLGAKCREGNSIGPACRIGGEVEESIIQGYSNKYHDGFLGHAYVGEWVNLGALTTNSDLKNDYTSVSVTLDGRMPIDTGSTKVGSLIGDHTKTSIGTLLNTGSYVGAMALLMATGKPMAKFIPSFTWLIDGFMTKGFGKRKLYETAVTAMSRRKQQWTPAIEAMWDAIYELTAGPRVKLLKRDRKKLARKK